MRSIAGIEQVPQNLHYFAESPVKHVDKPHHHVYIVGMAALLGTFEQIILLAVLQLEEGAYGRAVLRVTEANFDDGRAVSAGAVYATLDRLESEGLMSSRLEEGTPARGGRVRRFYRVTALGSDALNEARTVLERMWNGVPRPIEVNG